MITYGSKCVSTVALKVPFLVPSLLYSFETLVQCHSDAGVTDSIKVLLIIFWLEMLSCLFVGF